MNKNNYRQAVMGLILALSASKVAAQAGNNDVGRLIAGAMAEGICSTLELSVFATDSMPMVKDLDRQSLSRCAWFAETKRQKAAGMPMMTFDEWSARYPLLVAEDVSGVVWLTTYNAYTTELPARYPSVAVDEK